MQNTDVAANYEGNVYKILLHIKVTNAKDIKARENEQVWLKHFGWFFNMISEKVAEVENAAVLKFLNDGMVAAFSEEQAAEVLNTAVAIQEAMLEHRNRTGIPLECSLGISSGEVVKFTFGKNRFDYLGKVVDRAQSLAEVANGNAIFVDVDTVDAANLRKLESEVGKSLNPPRGVADYRGELYQYKFKGIQGLVRYHEIFWYSFRFGISPAFETERLTQEGTPAPVERIKPKLEPVTADFSPAPTSVNNENRCRGKVIQAFEEKGYGFIHSNEFPQNIFFHCSQVIGDVPAQIGDQAHFIPQITPKGEQAHSVIVVGNVLSGEVEWFDAQKGFGFITIRDQSSRKIDFFVAKTEVETELFPQMQVEFVVGENEHGLTARNVQKIGDQVHKSNLQIGTIEKGVVTDYLLEKGYGFVECKGNRVFVHHSGLLGDRYYLESGDLVKFTVTPGREGGYRAEQVVKIGTSSHGDNLDDYYEEEPVIMGDENDKISDF